MGRSTHVIGIRPPDDHWKRMKAAWDACEEAGISPPDSVLEFFEGEKPDEKGVLVDITRDRGHPFDSEHYSAAEEWSDEYREGYEVDIKKLPKDVTIIRFYNSW